MCVNTMATPPVVTKLVIRSCGTFHLFSESLISAFPIRTELQGETLTFYNASAPLKQQQQQQPEEYDVIVPKTTAAVIASSSQQAPVSVGSKRALITESGSLITIDETQLKSPRAVAIAKRSRPQSGLLSAADFVQKSKQCTEGERIPTTSAIQQYKVEIIDTARKTVVVDRICYSWEKPPVGSPLLQDRKILVPFWLFNKLDQTANSIPLTADEYRADGVSYTVWTLKTGALAQSLVIIPACYMDEERQKLLVDEAQIYNPRVQSSSMVANTNDDNTDKNQMVQLLTTRKRRCSITEIDHSTTYNFADNKRCQFNIQHVELVPTNAHSGLNSKNPTALHMHGVSRTKFTTSIFYTDRRQTLTFAMRGNAQLHWRMPQSTFWAEHFSVNLQLYDQAQVELDGRAYQLTAELRNQARLLRFRAKEVKCIKAYDQTKVKGEACEQARVIWGQEAVIDIVKMNDPLL